MADDVLINKAAAIERAVRRVREEHAGDDRNLLENQTRQDAIILNLQRACGSSIDAAMHLVRVHRLRAWRIACERWWDSATSRSTTTRS
jgi:uncharacterized protein YutE (UPF0331/DUF86 family)